MRSIGDSIQKFELQVYYLIKIRILILNNFSTIVLLTTFFTIVLLTKVQYKLFLTLILTLTKHHQKPSFGFIFTKLGMNKF